MRDHFIARLIQMARQDPRIVLITGDLGFKVFDEFIESLPDQFINAGIAEQAMTGIATGMALEGRIAVTYSIANFSTLRCLEQIRNDAAYHGANVKVVAVGGGFSYGALGVSHHATEDIAILRSIPDVNVYSPGDVWEAAELTEAVIDRPGACYLRLDKSTELINEPTQKSVIEGKARMVREGTDLTLIATGGILSEAVKASDMLRSAGVQARVLSMHTIKPLDIQALQAAANETGGIITVEEHTTHGGLGSAVAECLMEYGPPPKFFSRVGLHDEFATAVGSQTYLRKRYGMDAEAIVLKAQAALNRTS